MNFTRNWRDNMPEIREEAMVQCAVDAILDKKGYNVKSLKVGDVTPITDYFVVASGSNISQVDALVDNVEEKMRDAGYTIVTREGRGQGGWVLLDYSEVVIHLFTSEMREFYNLDGTWRDVESKLYD